MIGRSRAAGSAGHATDPGSPRTSAVRSRRILVAALAVYLLAVVRITLWPEPAPDDTFDVVRAVLGWLNAHGIPITYAGLESAANVAMFVPFGVLVGLLLPRRRWWAVIALGAATSVAIELAQLAFLPSRVADGRDVVANTLGTALGLALLRLVTRVRATDRASAPGDDLRQGRPRAR